MGIIFTNIGEIGDVTKYLEAAPGSEIFHMYLSTSRECYLTTNVARRPIYIFLSTTYFIYVYFEIYSSTK